MTAYLHASHRLADASSYGFEGKDLMCMTGAPFRSWESGWDLNGPCAIDATEGVSAGCHTADDCGVGMFVWRDLK